MFKKIVSQLPFSPSMLHELGYYAKRLRQEEITRRTGLILTALVLVFQMFTIVAPVEPTNAAHTADLFYGGFSSKEALLAAYDNNTHNYRDFMQYAGITRQNLEKSQLSRGRTFHSRENGRDAGWRSWSRQAQFGPSRGETMHTIKGTNIYITPLSNYDTGNNVYGTGSWYEAFYGTNSKGQLFRIIKYCGNLNMQTDPPRPQKITVCRLADKKMVTISDNEFSTNVYSKNAADCKPPCTIPNKTQLKADDPNCKEDPKPVALCSGIAAEKLSETRVRLTGSSSVANGATVSAYTFIIKKASGEEVLRKTISGSSQTASIEITLPDGAYISELSVTTSLGEITSDQCRAQFAVAIPKCPVNPSLAATDPNCQTCIGDETLWFKDEKCSAKIIRTKAAKNLQTQKDATLEKAKAGERIEYALTVKNEGLNNATFDIRDELGDVLEYASLYDNGGGTFDENTKVLSWDNITLKPGEQQTRIYVVQVASVISPMPQGQSRASSYDCRMTNVFGNTIDVYIDCPTPKAVERIVTELPHTGAGGNMIFAGIFAAIVTFFYLRSRQLNKEVRIIRHNMTSGTL